MRQRTFFQKYYRLFAILAIPVFWWLLWNSQSQDLSYWLEFWWMAPIAFCLSLMVNSVGISGAALYFPFFILIFPLLAFPIPSLVTVKLSLIMESFGLTSSALSFMAYGVEDRKLAFWSIVQAIPFVVLGAMLVLYLPEYVLILAVAASFIMSIFMLRYSHFLKRQRLKQQDQTQVDLTVSHGDERTVKSHDHRVYRYCLTPKGYKKRFFGLSLGGLFQGATGFGIGEMGLLGMFITKIPVRVAIGTSHLVVAFTAILAAFLHVFMSSAFDAPIPWNIPFVAVPAIILSGQLAPYLDSKVSARNLERFISVLFVVIGIALLLVAMKKYA